MQNKFAKIISIIGHPFITIPLFVLIVMFSYSDFKNATLVSFLIIGGIFIPIALWNFFNTKKGIYTNFDVSVRAQRKSMFFFIIPLLALITLILFLTDQPDTLTINVLFALILVVVSLIVNQFIKSSLHISFTVYLSFLVVPINLSVGIIIFFSTILIGWSRIKLGKHTLTEVIAGMIIGLFISLVMLYVERYF